MLEQIEKDRTADRSGSGVHPLESSDRLIEPEDRQSDRGIRTVVRGDR